MTLIEIVNLLTDLGNSHLFIKTVKHGHNINENGSDTEDIQYPAFFIDTSDVIYNQTDVERTFTLTICDLVLPDRSNHFKVLSDTETSFNEIVEFLRQESNDFTLIGEPIISNITDRYGDAVAGWQAQVVISTVNTAANYCGLPIDGFIMTGSSLLCDSRTPGFQCSDLLKCAVFTSLVDKVDGLSQSITIPDTEIVFGTGTGITSSSDLTFDGSTLRIRKLSGSTYSMVVADENGVLSTQSIPTGGGGNVAIPTTQVPYGNTSSTGLTSSNKLTFNGSRLNLTSTTIDDGATFRNNSVNLGGQSPLIVNDGASTIHFGWSGTHNTNNSQYSFLTDGGGLTITTSPTGTAKKIELRATTSEIRFNSPTSIFLGHSEIINNNGTLRYRINGDSSNNTADWVRYNNINTGTNYAGTTLPVLHSSHLQNRLSGGANSGVMVFGGTPIVNLVGSIGTNLATRLDTIGLHIRDMSGIHNANVYPFQVQNGPYITDQLGSFINVALGNFGGNATVQFKNAVGRMYGATPFKTGIEINNTTDEVILFNGSSGSGIFSRLKTLTGGVIQISSLNSGVGGTSSRMVQVNSTGDLSAPNEIIDTIITDSTVISNITNGANWTILGVYTGTTLVNAFAGQKYRDAKYKYEMYTDTEPIRTARI